jgi:Fur family peroxide stress response transcriptional regulator
MRGQPKTAHVRAQAMLADLKRAGLKMTPQRIAIVRLFAGDPTHPTAQDLFERLRRDFPSMSFATVYNTLDALAAAGLCSTLRLGSAASRSLPSRRDSASSRRRPDARSLAPLRATRFDPNITPHHHALCERCGTIHDVPAATLAPTAAAVRNVERKAPGFLVRSVERIYRGLCSACSDAEQASDSPNQ